MFRTVKTIVPTYVPTLFSSVVPPLLCFRVHSLAHGTGDDYLLEQVTHYGSQLPMYIERITGKQNSRDSRLGRANTYLVVLM